MTARNNLGGELPMEPYVTIPEAEYEALIESIEAHKRIVQHDPKTPGLGYPSIEALLESAISHSRQALAALRTAGVIRS